MLLEKNSIIAWLNGMKTETGHPIDLVQGYFMYDIFRDFSSKLAIQKPAQVRATTTQILKTFWGMERYGLEAIYTLPTVGDAQEMSKAKINRLITNNPKLQELVKEMDTVGQKMVGGHMLYIRGTWTEKAAMMFPSDWNLYDEVDSSKQETIEQYATRLQHSKFKWEHYFSHPSTENVGVNKPFNKSDQKHWAIRCSSCSKRQILMWPENVDIERRVYVCKYCKKELSDNDRRVGEWVKKKSLTQSDISGYQISLLMTPWTTAKEIIKYYEDKSPEYFNNKVLGLPYVGAGNKVTWDIILRNIRTHDYPTDGRMVIGIDTGGRTYYVIGNKYGIFYYGSCDGYDEIYRLMDDHKSAVIVIDGNGDPTATKQLKSRYQGRVFTCYFTTDRKSDQIVRWLENEKGVVHADRNKLIQHVVDEFTGGYIPVYAEHKPEEWHDYWVHWSNMYREEEENALGVPVKKWKRNGDDHWALATCYFRVGIERFAHSLAKIFRAKPPTAPMQSVKVGYDDTIVAPDPKTIWKKIG